MDSSCTDNLEYEAAVDPELKKVREEGLAKTRVDYEKMAKELSAEVEEIHSAYLFQPEGKNALKQICTNVSSVPANVYHVSWKDLASELGLSFSQIGCIENYKHDYTETVLRAFCQKSDASLALLVQAFLRIGHSSALHIAKATFPALAECAKRDYSVRIKHADRQPNQGSSKILFKPQNIRCIGKCLPITLQKLRVHKEKCVEENPGMKEELSDDLAEESNRRLALVNLTASPIPKPQKRVPRYSKKIMLTFASDCKDVAEVVKNEFMKERSNLLPAKVITLEDYESKVQLNPENFIAHNFVQMDYIIPILSERYFECICNQGDGGMDQLEEDNINLIFTHMCYYYKENRCLNDKIRCIIPRRFQNSVFNNPHFKMNLIFKVYTYDSSEEINKLFERLVKPKK